MFQFCSLYSGSSGNCSLIQTDTTNILIDAGESCKKITDALSSLHITPDQIDAILVTHEHSDHVKGLGTFSKKYAVPVFANHETWDAMPSQKEKIAPSQIHTFHIGKNLQIGNIQIEPFSIPHDAANPCGFNIFYEQQKISIATDIGHLDRSILQNLCYSCFILLESNYDPNILKCSSYPYSLKERIAGPNGHLSNDMAGKVISYLTDYGLKTAMLGHLSKESNFPELAYKTVLEKLIENHANDKIEHLSVAMRNEPSKVIQIG